jgi:hypothetical protein
MGCAGSLPLRSSNYSVQPFKDGSEDKLYDKHWENLPKALLLRIAAEAGVGAWRLNLVSQAWRAAVHDAPRRVRFQAQALELIAKQIAWVRKSGDDAAQWRVEAVGDAGAAFAAEALRSNPALREFGVHRGRRREGTLGLRGASKLALAITDNRGLRLEKIDLSGSSIKHLGAEKLCRALTTTATQFLGGSALMWLDLARNEIGDKGAQAVASFITAEGSRTGNGQALRYLNLTSNSIGCPGLAALAEATAATSGGCRLETCILSWNPLVADVNGSARNGGKSLVSLVEAFHATIRALETAGCGLGTEGTNNLVAAWAKHPVGLTSLDLSNNGIGDGGAAAIGNLLAGGGCPRLATLNIASNGIGDSGAAELGRGTRAEACRLRELDVCDNRIGDDGAIALSLALDASAGLTELHHDSNAIGTAGETAIARSVLRPA